jgi:hypothetical protein
MELKRRGEYRSLFYDLIPQMDLKISEQHGKYDVH